MAAPQAKNELILQPRFGLWRTESSRRAGFDRSMDTVEQNGPASSLTGLNSMRLRFSRSIYRNKGHKLIEQIHHRGTRSRLSHGQAERN